MQLNHAARRSNGGVRLIDQSLFDNPPITELVIAIINLAPVQLRCMAVVSVSHVAIVRPCHCVFDVINAAEFMVTIETQSIG